MRRLGLHAVVRVTVPQESGNGFEAAVLALSERGVTLECLNKNRVLRLRDVTPGAYVTFRYRDTLVALAGTLFCVKPAGDLRFQLSEECLYRKRGTRMKVEMPLTVRSLASSLESVGTTVDIGPDGMLFESELEATVGDRLNVSFTSQQADKLVSGVVDVVRAGEGMIAVHVPPETHDVRDALGEIVVGLSRAELHHEAHEAEVGPGF